MMASGGDLKKHISKDSPKIEHLGTIRGLKTEGGRISERSRSQDKLKAFLNI